MRAAALFAITCLGCTFGSPWQLNAESDPPSPGPATVGLPRALRLAQRQPPSASSGSRRKRQAEEDLDATAQRRAARRRPAASYSLPALELALAVAGVAGARGLAVPVVLLPVPAERSWPRLTSPSECSIGSEEDKHAKDAREDDDYEDSPEPTPKRPTPARPPARPPARRPDPHRHREQPALQQTLNETAKDDQPRYPSYVRADQLDETASIPSVSVAASSKELIEKFRVQTPTAPELPPVLFSEYDSSERLPRPDEYASSASGEILPTESHMSENGSASRSRGNIQNGDPPRPRFERSLLLRGELSAARADYTETYTAWWDAANGAARVDFYGGSTSTYRTIAPDGSVRWLEMRVDRSGEGAVRRCGTASAGAPLSGRAERGAPPGLPDLEAFTFAGYEQTPAGPVERWRHTRTGGDGELGAARGETLSFRHELMLARADDLSALPLRYSVVVDSSVLGAASDGYEHRYVSVREQQHPSQLFAADVDDLCDSVELLNSSLADHFARLEPLKEFTLPHRDLRYDEAIQRFKVAYNRQYIDDSEEAMRKNILMQHTRFTLAGNREGATFELAVNFLGDRLDAELQELLGARADAATRGPFGAEPFPHARASVRRLEPGLPAAFDWRPRGAVSPVRYQGSCASCWAFAVAGAVEGALFRRTRRLTPLSEKCLVDCAHPFGGNGCRGTWPSRAYDYVRSRGLPALEDYPPYVDKVERCAEAAERPATRISAHVNVTAHSVSALQVAIRRHAPTVVIVDAKAKSFVFYKKGVLYDDRCGKAGSRLNHAVLAVGWGRRGAETHFVLKNSWSEAWGERGYVRVQARANTCGVLAQPSYPRLERPDVRGAASRADDP